MHPTPEEQLGGAQRLLAAVADDAALSAASRESLTNVRRLLTQVSRSWAALLPFYLEDNRRLTALLTATAGIELTPAEAEPTDVGALAARNADLRQALSDVIHGLSGDARSDALRDSIHAYLTARVDADPS